MRLLYLASELHSRGGIQRYSRAQIQALRSHARISEMKVLVQKYPRDDLFEEPFPVDWVGRGSGTQAKIALSLKVLSTVARDQPDLIWTNHLHLLPLVHTSALSSPKSIKVCNVYGREVWSDLGWYRRKSLQSADLLVSDAQFTAGYVVRKLGIGAGSVQVIWDPVDTNQFRPTASSRSVLPRYGVPNEDGMCYLMTLGRVSANARHKGYDRMLDVMGSLDRRDIRYLIAGDGDDVPRLRSRVRQVGLDKRVFFLGSIEDHDLVDVYNSIDVFVLVSDRGKGRGEGVPLTPLEAAACGKPVIVGNADGSREAAIDGVTGYVVSPTVGEISEAIMLLADAPRKRTEFGRSGREFMVREFSREVFEDRCRELLDGLW